MKTLIIFFAFSVLIHAQKDAYEWRAMDNHDRKLYLEGIFAGLPLGGMFAIYLLNKSQQKKSGESFNYCNNEYCTNVTVEQICEGLDSLYSDYRNQTIPINYGVWAVLNSIRGIPQQAYEGLVQSLRKGVLPK